MATESDLLLAVLRGAASDVSSALAHGADPDAVDSLGWSVLMWAAGRGDTGMIDTLLAGGADVFVEDVDGRTAYAIAAAAGHLAAMQVLADAEQRVDPRRATGSSRRHEQRAYCRPYPAELLRRFRGWREPVPDAQGDLPIGPDTPLFVHRSLRVTRSVFEDEGLVFPGDTTGWADFCRRELGFKPIDDRDWLTAVGRVGHGQQGRPA